MYDFRKKRKQSLNHYFLNLLNKYGSESFVFSVIEYCEVDELAERELYWIDYYNSTNPSNGFNLRRDSSTGSTVTDMTKAKISERLLKEWATGVRKYHSSKLKESWRKRDRIAQGKVFSEILTTYVYFIGDSETPIKYSELVELGLKSVMSAFSRQKSDEVFCKGIKVRRVKV